MVSLIGVRVVAQGFRFVEIWYMFKCVQDLVLKTSSVLPDTIELIYSVDLIIQRDWRSCVDKTCPLYNTSR